MISASKWAKLFGPKLADASPLMTKIWITRTRPAADESAEAWREAGFDPIVEPLLTIASVDHDLLPRETIVIFTSKNGVDHVSCAGQRAICVGDATAEHARKAGFSDVISVNGTSRDVTRWVVANCSVSQSICHVSGHRFLRVCAEGRLCHICPQFVLAKRRLKSWKVSI